jgi:hypothetical protein
MHSAAAACCCTEGEALVDLKLRHTLATWAKSKPEVIALYVFGSRAKGTAGPDSDLDLAFEIDARGTARKLPWWQTASTGAPNWRPPQLLPIGPLYLRSDPNVRWETVVEVYRRATD